MSINIWIAHVERDFTELDKLLNKTNETNTQFRVRLDFNSFIFNMVLSY